MSPLGSPHLAQLAPLTPPESASENGHLAAKKKKKKRAKKSAQNKEPPVAASIPPAPQDTRPVLSISRNKHWKYISSYHGPWLQLPVELLESLLALNCDPATLAPPLGNHEPWSDNHTPPRTPLALAQHVPRPKPSPPPIDPGVFRSVLAVRRLVEEATDLAVRASSGLSAAALNSMSGLFGDPAPNCGRSVTMSATRAHRLRALAVQRLADAYRTDEIAASVMVMQGASSLDDIAERVLAVDPNDLDAKYVHFFHEKIPSRQLAESTTTEVLDALIAARPQRLEYFRTRGIVYCFREEYAKAVRDFTHALKESRAARKSRHPHVDAADVEHRAKGKRGKRAHGHSKKTNGQAPPDGTSAPDPSPPLVHPSVLPDAPEPMEPQTLFLRGSAYLQHAVHLVERTLLDIEQVRKPGLGDGAADMRLSYIENGRYGGLEIGHPDGPLGARDGEKRRVYVERMGGDAALKENIDALARKAIRDQERFLAHFDTVLASVIEADSFSTALVPHANGNGNGTDAGTTTTALPIATYHPLLVESHFSILIALLLLGDFVTLLPTLTRVAALVEGLEGYPVFLPARSMAQSELFEMLDRLLTGWENGNGAVDGVPDSPLEHARALLASVAARRPTKKESAEVSGHGHASRNGGGAGTGRWSSSLNFPMHGPRVEVVLAWLGAVHLPALDAEAEALHACTSDSATESEATGEATD